MRHDGASTTWLRRVLDFSIAAGAALLGCALLVAAGMHLLASLDVTPDGIAVQAPIARAPSARAPSATRPAVHRPAVTGRVVARLPAGKSFGARASHVVVRRGAPALRISPRTNRPEAPSRALAVAARTAPGGAIPAAARIGPRTPRTVAPGYARLATVSAARARPPAALARVRVAPGARAVAFAPRARQPARGRRPVPKRLRDLGEPPIGYRAEPTLVGVAGTAVAIEPNLAGLRMRGRIIAPTPKPLPSPSPWPVARSGLTPGP